MKCKRSFDGRKLDHHTLQVMRQQAVKAVREGVPVTSVAAAYGLSVRTIFSWLAKFGDGEQNALLAKPISGRPPKISAEEMRWIAQAVRDNSLQQFKFEFGLWTLALIRELIKRQFGKSLALASVSRVMNCLASRFKSRCTRHGNNKMPSWSSSGKPKPIPRSKRRPVPRALRSTSPMKPAFVPITIPGQPGRRLARHRLSA